MEDLDQQPKEQLSARTHRPSVAAMVTLYNSEPEVVRRIGTYISQVSKLYLVDNSERPDKQLIQQIRAVYPNTEYISNEGNQGIAYALNVAAQVAVSDKYDYLLTMDDDSSAPDGMVDGMIRFITTYQGDNELGIVAPQANELAYGNGVTKVWYTITSGSLLCLKAYQNCGPFMNELFIDSVDHEYCFRLKRAGYEIVELDYLHLQHRVGFIKKLSLFGNVVYRWSSHSPLRDYYILRNNLYVLRYYWKDLPVHLRNGLAYAAFKVCFVYALFEKDRGKRFQYVGQAIRDFANHRLGKYSHET